MLSPDDVLEYWFGDLTNPEAAPATVSRWFKGGPEVDEEIRARFGDALEPARRGELDAWAATPRGALALLILLDQRHQQVIKRFGRFPHRNQILGRPSTPEELEFLKEPGSSF